MDDFQKNLESFKYYVKKHPQYNNSIGYIDATKSNAKIVKNGKFVDIYPSLRIQHDFITTHIAPHIQIYGFTDVNKVQKLIQDSQKLWAWFSGWPPGFDTPTPKTKELDFLAITREICGR